MLKIIAFFNQREHFKNRLKERKGNIFFLFLAKKIKNIYPRQDGVCIYRYKHHIFFIQNYKLQTYINKLKPKSKKNMEKTRIEKAREEMQEQKIYSHSEKFLQIKESKIKKISLGYFNGNEEKDLKTAKFLSKNTWKLIKKNSLCI